MAAALKYLLYALALVACLTGLNVLIGGGAAIPGASGPAEAAIDNELRFFAVFWLAYGAFCFWVASRPSERQHFVPAIAIIFFVGGVARLLSLIIIGSPGPILSVAMVLEWVLPLVLYGLHVKSRQLP